MTLPIRARFEAHERRVPARARLLQAHPGDTACYADGTTQARWEFWQAAQPPGLDLRAVRLYLSALKLKAPWDAQDAARYRTGQKVMRLVQNSNLELFGDL